MRFRSILAAETTPALAEKWGEPYGPVKV